MQSQMFRCLHAVYGLLYWVSRKRRPKTKDLEKGDPLENEDLEKEDPLENEDLENEDPLEKH